MNEYLDKKKVLHKKYLWKIANEKLKNDSNLITLLNYNDISLWWYLDLPLNYALKNLFIDLNFNSNSTIKKNESLNNLRLYSIIFLGLIFLVIRISTRFIFGKLTYKKSGINEHNILIPSSSQSWRDSSQGTKKKKESNDW